MAMGNLRLKWQRFRFAIYRWILPRSWDLRLSIRRQRREVERLFKAFETARDPDERQKRKDDFDAERFFLDEAGKDLRHLRSRRLVDRAFALDLGGWPENNDLYEDEGYERRSNRLILDPQGFAYMNKKIRDEQHARISLWKERIAVFSPIVTPLVSALIGAVTALVARSC